MTLNPYDSPKVAGVNLRPSLFRRPFWFFFKAGVALMVIVIIARWINPFGVFDAGSPPTLVRLWIARLLFAVYVGFFGCLVCGLIALTGWRIEDYRE